MMSSLQTQQVGAKRDLNSKKAGVVLKFIPQRPHVFSYQDHRLFLKDLYDYLKAHRNFSYRRFAQKSGLKSPSYLRMVIHGKRELTEDVSQKVAMGLGLKPDESLYFCILVLSSRISSLEIRSFLVEGFRRFHSTQEGSVRPQTNLKGMGS